MRINRRMFIQASVSLAPAVISLSPALNLANRVSGQSVKNVAWSFRTEGKFQSLPVVADGRMLLFDTANTLRSYEILTFEEKWKIRKAINFAPTFWGNSAFFTNGELFLSAVNADSGEPLWTSETWGGETWVSDGILILEPYLSGPFRVVDGLTGEELGEVSGYPNFMPTIGNEILIVAYDETLYFYEMPNWYELGSIFYEDSIGSIAPYEDWIYFGDDGGNAQGLNISKGFLDRELISWTYDLKSNVSGAPVATPNCIVFRTVDGTLAGLDPFSGDELWRASSPLMAGEEGTVAFSASNEQIVIMNNDGSLTSIDIIKGTQNWTVAPERSLRFNTAPDGDVLFAVSSDGNLQKFSGSNGAENTVLRPPGTILGEPITSGKTAFTITVDNEIIALSIETGQPIWNAVFEKRLTGPFVAAEGILLAAWSLELLINGEQTISSGLYALDVTNGSIIWDEEIFRTTEPDRHSFVGLEIDPTQPSMKFTYAIIDKYNYSSYSSNRQVLILQPDSGAVIAGGQDGNPILLMSEVDAPVFWNDVFYGQTTFGDLAAFRKISGEVAWEQSRIQRDGSPMHRVLGVVGDVLVSIEATIGPDQYTYVVGLGDASTGLLSTVLFLPGEYDHDFFSTNYYNGTSLVTSEETLHVSNVAKGITHLTRINPGSAQIEWHIEVQAVVERLVGYGIGTLFYVTSDGQLYSVHDSGNESPELVWESSGASGAELSTVFDLERNVLLIGEDEFLHKIDLS